MSTKSAKEAVLGVTGSIAAYKACEIASLLVKEGVKVIPVLSEGASQFVGAASFEAITGNRVYTAMFEPLQNPEIDHIAVAARADLFLVAPATAHVLAKAAHGLADDWLTTTLLATRAPVLFAPAMNTNMYDHVATQSNVATLKSRGCHFVGPESGVLACKTVGIGRMAEPADVVEAALGLLYGQHDLSGKNVLITSGGNHEPIDAVRFIGNRSSGKMGYALARNALRRGAEVTVVSGPAAVRPPQGTTVVEVETALEMRQAVLARSADADVVIGAAAVADYRVEEPETGKHKRDGSGLVLHLTENPDILAEVGAAKKNGQIVVGFAAETDELVANGKIKLEKKHLDLVVANVVGTPDSGFGTDTVKASIIQADGRVEELPLLTKDALAERLLDSVVRMLG